MPNVSIFRPELMQAMWPFRPAWPSLVWRLLGLALAVPLAGTFAYAAAAARPALEPRYDLIVYGATPGGLACAVRAAREGLTVLVVSPYAHLGGLLANGLSTMDTLYNGARSPLYDELRAAIHEHYRSTYGEDSPQYRASLPGNPKTKFEAHVLERLITGLFERERKISLVRNYHPVAAARHGSLVENVTFRTLDGNETFTVGGMAFADCSYEGDLAAVTGVPYRVGREARDEFGEEHAGRIFMTHAQWPPPAHVDSAHIADYRRLNLVHYNRWYDIIRPASTGEADGTVQAYNLRTVITCDPTNRLPAEKPPGYDRDALVRRLQSDVNWLTTVPTVGQPNRKTYLNLPELVGRQREYPEGDWATRRRIRDEHAFITRSLIYFMQHDPSVPESTRVGWREWGLPRDEFADNGHLPYEIYVREARRIDGRARFTEHDARLEPGLRRAPIHRDAITITEWFLDSHACTPERLVGSMYEGELLLNHVTFPGQVSFRTLLPEGLDNLLVPVCVSSSHIGWGALRLEPVWMSLGEAAAHAVLLARAGGTTPAGIDADRLVRRLAARGFIVAFFNDVEVDPREPWWPAVQYLGTQGFFGDYEADPLGPVTEPVAAAWCAAAAEWIRSAPVDAHARARRILAAQAAGGPPVTVGRFLALLTESLSATPAALTAEELLRRVPLATDIRLSRGNACRLILAAGD